MILKFISTQTLIAIHIGTFGIFYGTYPLDLRFWSQLKKGDCKDVVSPKQKYIFLLCERSTYFVISKTLLW